MRDQIRSACRALLTMGLVVTTLAIGACSGGGEDATDKTGAAATAKSPPPPIERVPGMKFYVGGPVLKQDRYGRERLMLFSGEVSAPTTRGLLIGFKPESDGEDFDYRTYINGRLVANSTGFLVDDLLWFKERFSYNSAGQRITHQTFTYDDASEMMTSRLEHLDPESGEVIEVIDEKIPYSPPEDDEEDSFFDDMEE